MIYEKGFAALSFIKNLLNSITSYTVVEVFWHDVSFKSPTSTFHLDKLTLGKSYALRLFFSTLVYRRFPWQQWRILDTGSSICSKYEWNPKYEWEAGETFNLFPIRPGQSYWLEQEEYKQEYVEFSRDVTCYPASFVTKKKLVEQSNPYTLTSVGSKDQFHGREDILRLLKTIWTKNKVESVIIYGIAGIGKTSLIRYASQYFSEEVKIAYLNLEVISYVSLEPQEGKLLFAIASNIAQVTKVPLPTKKAFLVEPHKSFKAYLKQLQGSLIIALDDFEILINRILEGSISKTFITYLQECISPKLGFAICCTQNLVKFLAQELPIPGLVSFFSYLIPIHVSFMSRQETSAVLRASRKYTEEAIERVYQLTNGHPYLIQAIGHILVRYSNSLRHNQSNDIGQSMFKNYSFTKDNVDMVVEKKEIFNSKYGQHFFCQLWLQSIMFPSFTITSQETLSLLACKQQGLTLEKLSKSSIYKMPGDTISKDMLLSVLKFLQESEVIVSKEGRYSVTIELLHLWQIEQ